MRRRSPGSTKSPAATAAGSTAATSCSRRPCRLYRRRAARRGNANRSNGSRTKGQLSAYLHLRFWQPMDTLRDKRFLVALGVRSAVAEMVRPDFWKGKRVFLTGHTGFKGSWLALRLVDLGASVFGYSLAPETAPSAYGLLRISELIDETIGDIREEEALARADAWGAPRDRSAPGGSGVGSPWIRATAANVRDKRHWDTWILEAVRRCDDVRQVLVVTSDKTHANREARPQRENDPLGGADPYSASKACADWLRGCTARLFSQTALGSRRRAPGT